MSLRKLRTLVGILCWLFAFSLAGCRMAPQPSAAEAGKVAEDAHEAAARDEAHEVAEASLGKQAEVLAHGDLALTGREQVLVVNRMSAAGAAGGAPTANPPAILVRRAAVLEKDGGKWSQVLLCDEYLKNPNGYLGRSASGRVSGWRLEYRQDAQQGLRMKFTPAENARADSQNADEDSGETRASFDVRWNKSAKRYQSFDQSHERYLSEVPSLGIPQSILK
jgi:hypothetical protein